MSDNSNDTAAPVAAPAPTKKARKPMSEEAKRARAEKKALNKQAKEDAKTAATEAALASLSKKKNGAGARPEPSHDGEEEEDEEDKPVARGRSKKRKAEEVPQSVFGNLLKRTSMVEQRLAALEGCFAAMDEERVAKKQKRV